MYLLYSALMATGLLLSLPYWMLTRRHGKYREGLGERPGRVPPRLQPQLIRQSARGSVGEVLAVSALVKELRGLSPVPGCGFNHHGHGPEAGQTTFGEESVFTSRWILDSRCNRISRRCGPG
jgi:3-deoxy-D-manno-octulosonic-acid transferase